MPNQVRTFFAFQDTKTGELARLESTDDYHRLVRPSRYDEYPVFEADSLESLAFVLFENTPSYNSNSRMPGWGEFKVEELVPVQATITTQVEPVALPTLLNVKTVSLRDIPYIVARRYAGGDFEQREDRGGLTFWLIELPEGATVESFKNDWVGQSVFGGDRYTRRHVYACVPVPEEYVDLCKGKPGALLIASNSFYG